MNEEKEFFSPKHKQLLSIATWAGYAAWIALVFAFILPITRYVEIQNRYEYQNTLFGQNSDFKNELKTNPVYGISVSIDSINSFLTGFIYFLVLRGVSLGLNMIVETDINYREKMRRTGGGDEK